MSSDNQRRIYAAVGLAGQMGCLMAVVVLIALGVGVWLDQQFNTRRIAILICIGVSLPFNLGLAYLLTMRLAKRIIPPDKPKGGAGSPDNQASA